ncbi:MAG: hypothetical protein Q4C96_05270 [Planctomycetia bacterium]|nr:hypothetical protein [Planctomycetia bacterium]
MWKYLGGVLFFCFGIFLARDGNAHPEKFMVEAENRYAIIVDATKPEMARKSEYLSSLEKISESIQSLGIPEKNIQILSSFQKPATLQEIKNSLNKKHFKESDKPQELLMFITAYGVTNGQRDMILPADVEPESVQETVDERLISFDALQEEIYRTGAGKILLVMNFKSIRIVARSLDAESALRNINIRRYRGLRASEYFDDPEEEVETESGNASTAESGNNSTRNFQFLQIVTRDQNVWEQRIDHFYSSLENALAGYADISGNNDGWIQAEELAYYIRDHAAVTMEISRNGNAVYVLGKSAKSARIPPGLFREIGNTFTRQEFSQERESAMQREQNLNKVNAVKKENPERSGRTTKISRGTQK